jgi:hypothetical protein
MAAALLLALGRAAPVVLASAAPRQSVPEVRPTTRKISLAAGRLPIPDRVVEVVGPGTDPSVRKVIEAALTAAGAHHTTKADAGDRPPSSGLTVQTASARCPCPGPATGPPPRSAESSGASTALPARTPSGSPNSTSTAVRSRTSTRQRCWTG